MLFTAVLPELELVTTLPEFDAMWEVDLGLNGRIVHRLSATLSDCALELSNVMAPGSQSTGCGDRVSFNRVVIQQNLGRVEAGETVNFTDRLATQARIDLLAFQLALAAGVAEQTALAGLVDPFNLEALPPSVTTRPAAELPPTDVPMPATLGLLGAGLALLGALRARRA